MAFADHMKRHLNPPKSISDDNEWYLKATTEALNEWMMELETALMVPSLTVNGSCITPAGVTIPYTVPSAGYFVPKMLRFTLLEVKGAMWCGDAEKSFENLFDLVGTKIAMNFSKVIAVPALIGGQGIPALVTSHFKLAGSALVAWAKAMGAPMKEDPETATITPESFLEQESTLLLNAVKSIPPVPTPAIGDPIPATPVACPGGIFVGTIGVNFANAR